jgi:hypothetical protein
MKMNIPKLETYIITETAGYSYYSMSSSTFSLWAYLPFVDFFLNPEEFAIDFDESDFWIYYPDDK